METQRVSAKFVAVAVRVGFVAVNVTQANAQERVRWKIHCAFVRSLAHLGPSGIRFQKPCSLVPAVDAFNSVPKGAIESVWTSPVYLTGKPGGAISSFTTVPFDPQLGEFLAWMWFGDGHELREGSYNMRGVTAFDGLCIGPETSDWFKSGITSLEEPEGLKIRFFAGGALVMPRMGVSSPNLDPPRGSTPDPLPVGAGARADSVARRPYSPKPLSSLRAQWCVERCRRLGHGGPLGSNGRTGSTSNVSLSRWGIGCPSRQEGRAVAKGNRW